MNILILKTNLITEEDRLKIKPLLDNNPLIKEWSVDTEDVDKILRVVTPEMNELQLIGLIEQNGYQCYELD